MFGLLLALTNIDVTRDTMKNIDGAEVTSEDDDIQKTQNVRHLQKNIQFFSCRNNHVVFEATHTWIDVIKMRRI